MPRLAGRWGRLSQEKPLLVEFIPLAEALLMTLQNVRQISIPKMYLRDRAARLNLICSGLEVADELLFFHDGGHLSTVNKFAESHLQPPRNER